MKTVAEVIVKTEERCGQERRWGLYVRSGRRGGGGVGGEDGVAMREGGECGDGGGDAQAARNGKEF